MKVYEGQPEDLSKENVQEFVIYHLILSFVEHHHVDPTAEDVLSWRDAMSCSLYAEDEWFNDKEFIDRTFFPQFCKELELFFSGSRKKNRIVLQLNSCFKFLKDEKNGKKIWIEKCEIGNKIAPGVFTISALELCDDL